MKVLHVYSHATNTDAEPRLAHYVSLLIEAMPADVECATADNASDVRLAVEEFRPDIIHQHGRWPAAMPSPRDGTARLVVSPHGETVDTSKAYSVIARSPFELSILQAPRKELVRDPLITKTITFEEAASAIHAIYKRVVASHPLQLMDKATRRLLAVLLKAGLLGDKRWVESAYRPMPHIPQLLIYASLEGVLPLVERGFRVFGAAMPEMPPVDCYLPAGYRKPEAMPVAGAAELISDMAASGVTLLRLTELMAALHSDSLDEAALLATLDEKKQRPLLASLLQLLSEQMLLTEGFMPCPPADDTYTADLRQQIENHLRIV